MLPHGQTLPEGVWQSRHRVLLWLLWAHVAAMPVISLLFDQGPAQAALDCATAGVYGPVTGVIGAVMAADAVRLLQGDARYVGAVGSYDGWRGAQSLVDTIRRVGAGERVIDPASAIAAVSRADNPLTPREMEVLRLAADGTPPAEIADRLYLSAGTVRNYLSTIVQKLGVRGRMEAIRTAERAGWLWS